MTRLEEARAGWMIVGMAWEQIVAGKWIRFLVRKSRHTGKLEVTRLHWVEYELALCWACLSHMVQVLPSYENPPRFRCLDCGAVTWVDPELN